MELILLEKVKNLGALGKKVKVKPGYARNYLLPQKKAVIASPENIKYFDERKEELLNQEATRLEMLKQRAASLQGMEVTISALASEEGKLYGSIGAGDIADAINAAGGKANKNEIFLPNGAIRELGMYEIQLDLHHGEINSFVNLQIVAKSKS